MNYKDWYADWSTAKIWPCSSGYCVACGKKHRSYCVLFNLDIRTPFYTAYRAALDAAKAER